MFYYLAGLSDWFSGLNIFRYITFRSGMAAVTTFLLCVIFGPFFIKKFQQLKIQEVAKRKDCPNLDQFMHSKEGTPTMGGVFLVGSVLISVLLWADLSNPFILMASFSCLWLAVLGGIDDYLKLTRKGKQRGLPARRKLFWQVMLGLLIGGIAYFGVHSSSRLDVPFFKDFFLDLGVFYVPFVAVVIVGASNAVNLTDGLDGLAIGCVMIVTLTLGVLSYITGHLFFSQYLFIEHVSGAGELTVFCAALLGASLGFLWFNCFPASIFMGDVGSLALGGSLGAVSVLIKKELLLILLGGVFVLEALSVILQVLSFKTTGKRIFKMAPFHHHLQMSGWKESKIIIRFWIAAIILALLTLTTLKIR